MWRKDFIVQWNTADEFQLLWSLWYTKKFYCAMKYSWWISTPVNSTGTPKNTSQGFYCAMKYGWWISTPVNSTGTPKNTSQGFYCAMKYGWWISTPSCELYWLTKKNPNTMEGYILPSRPVFPRKIVKHNAL